MRDALCDGTTDGRDVELAFFERCRSRFCRAAVNQSVECGCGTASRSRYCRRFLAPTVEPLRDWHIHRFVVPCRPPTEILIAWRHKFRGVDLKSTLSSHDRHWLLPFAVQLRRRQKSSAHERIRCRKSDSEHLIDVRKRTACLTPRSCGQSSCPCAEAASLAALRSFWLFALAFRVSLSGTDRSMPIPLPVRDRQSGWRNGSKRLALSQEPRHQQRGISRHQEAADSGSFFRLFGCQIRSASPASNGSQSPLTLKSRRCFQSVRSRQRTPKASGSSYEGSAVLYKATDDQIIEASSTFKLGRSDPHRS